MKFTTEEEETIREIFDQSVSRDNVENHLTPEVYDFLQKENRIRTIVDTITFVPTNKFRPYESVNLTKFITKDVNISKFIESLTGSINTKYLVFIDMNFLILCPTPEEKSELQFKFQRASKPSAFNETIKIRGSSDHTELVDEFKNLSPADFLNHAFESHVDMFDYHGSNMQPYGLLSIVMYITKF